MQSADDRRRGVVELSETWRVGSTGVSARVSEHGAELVSVTDKAGEELLWQAGPEWPRHAPALFPVVGRLKGDALRHGGESYRVTQHGFARDRRFEWVERSEARAVLALTDDAESRAIFPFAFRLDATISAEGSRLTVAHTVSNPGDVDLPFSIGAHPGFRWPLVEGVEKSAHILEFEARETGVRRSVVDGGLLGEESDLPFDGVTLPLDEALFARDALVMPDVASRSVRYVALGPDGEELRALTVSWRGYRDLGVWSAPKGAPFLCVEPWRGMASQADWDGEFARKRGVVLLPPGHSQHFEWSVAV
ncbi:aldose 1-epimerase family protein [Chenggangzhangella methanolivorans]|uniref:aldose 1-epimerase family protein n=1 Tax=Chenggangzhangella methanolivorans TaxID=1437009 RepID=UPI003D16611C